MLHQILSTALSLSVVLGLIGCGPAPMQVEGTIVWDDQPLAEGDISFEPASKSGRVQLADEGLTRSESLPQKMIGHREHREHRGNAIAMTCLERLGTANRGDTIDADY
jgi:hypothetical protein